MPALNKKSNEYAETLEKLFEEAPKAVLGALLVSFVLRFGDPEGEEILPDEHERIQQVVRAEWAVLHDAGIIPQRPPKERP